MTTPTDPVQLAVALLHLDNHLATYRTRVDEGKAHTTCVESIGACVAKLVEAFNPRVVQDDSNALVVTIHGVDIHVELGDGHVTVSVGTDEVPDGRRVFVQDWAGTSWEQELTTPPAATNTRDLTGPYVEYSEARAAAWLNDVDRDNRAGTVAGNLDVDDEEGKWPGTGDDTRLDNVLALIDKALAEDIIRIVGPTKDVETMQTRDRDGVLSGARLLVQTRSGLTLVHDWSMWADDFTADKTGTAGALAALAEAASTIHRVMRQYAESDVH